MPKVSIIVPVYNTSKYLNKCIDSIINQVYKEDTKPYSEENFQTSELISPIFGSNNEVEDKPIYNDLDSDMEEVDEFLDSLKDFRKNL